MVATESQDVLNRRFVSDFASVLGFFNTLLGRDQVPSLIFRESTPDSVRFSNPHCVLETFRHHRAYPADGPRSQLAPFAFVFFLKCTPFAVVFPLKCAWGKEQVGMVPTAQPAQLP